MKPIRKAFSLAILVLMTSALLVGCNLRKPASGSSPGPGSSTGPFSISGVVTGLTSGSTGLVLQDNAGDDLTISGNGTFTFKTAIVNGKGYNVSISTPPSNPPQTCTVASGSGTATANVANVQITCSTGTLSIGGNVVGLLGTGLVLQNNGGDDLAVATSNPFTFKTAVAIGSTYLVTVRTQPTSPTQTCTVTNGTGTANANVGNIQITCSTGTISIGGTVTGLAKAGSGIVLQNNGGDSLSIRANGTFTMPTLVSAGSGYKITILAQPSGPNQTCTITNGTGTANANVTNVQIVCPAIFHTIGGTVVGLVGTGGGMQLLNNGGDNLVVNANGNFTFVSPIADNSFYDVSIFVDPTTQPQGCLVWGFQGTAIAAVTDVVVDCGHNDWTWMDGANTSNSKGSFTAQPNPPPNPPSQNNSTPGGRKFPATWTDLSGKLWFFGGYGYTYDPAVPLQPSYLGDMWVYIGTQNYGAGYFNYWQVVPPPNSVPPPRWGAVTWTDTVSGDLFLFGGQAGPSNFLNDLWKYNISGNSWTYLGGAVNQSGVYSAPGTIFPGSRWGANARLDPSGNVWLFGGDGYDSAGTLGLLNDLWKYNVATNQWSWISGSKTVNQTGNYGILGTAAASNVPGGRESSVAWLDGSGNFWLFGGFDFDSTGHQNALNDLWEFKSNQWTWMSGANVVNQAGVYGTLGVGAATNVPGARWSSAAWTDRNGNLWLFGGQGFDSTANGSLSDLWVYTGAQWIWVRGPSSVSQAGIYGIQANPVVWPHVVDDPGGRYEPGYWIDPFNQMWMFGGEGVDSTGTGGNGLLNDLWRYLPYPNYPSQN